MSSVSVSLLNNHNHNHNHTHATTTTFAAPTLPLQVTALCSQLTYAGMLCETTEVACGACDAPPPASDSSSSGGGGGGGGGGEKRRVTLSCDVDDVYAQLRDENFSNVHGILKRVARETGKSLEQRNTTDQSQLAEFVKKMPALQGQQRSLAAHMDLALKINRIKSSDIVTEMLEAELSMVLGHSKQGTAHLLALYCGRFTLLLVS